MKKNKQIIKASIASTPPPRPVIMRRVKNPRRACVPEKMLSVPELERAAMCLGGKAMKIRWRLHELQDYVNGIRSPLKRKRS